jgi:serine/threonine protein kinase/outer membrane protein assembly factor BamD (BamD/ComL family)
MTGQTVTHYRVTEQISAGANAVVYLGEDLSLGRDVVLKFLTPTGSDNGARFLHEARTISSLNHPNICTIYEIGEHEGRYFLALERLEGEVLTKLISGHALGTDRLLDIGSQIADALDAAHGQRIVHRDLKPANIFITRAGHVKLLDFGVAVLLPPRIRMAASRFQSTARTGTIPYMSPEQAQAKEFDHRSDLFSLGVVLYEMATGRRPFSGVTASETLSAISTRAPIAPREINPLVPRALERIIAKALEKKPELRYQTASDLKADLQRLRRDLEGTPALQLSRAGDPATRGRSGIWLLTAATGIVLLNGAIWLANLRREPHLPASPPLSERVVLPPASPPLPNPNPNPNTEQLPRARESWAQPSASAIRSPGVASRPSVPDSTDQLAIARQQEDLKLYPQAINTLRTIASGHDRKRAIEASFQIASIQELQGDVAGAMSTYIEIATRFAGDARAPEALAKLAQVTLTSKRRDSERDALRTIETLVSKYPESVWAPRALFMRAELESRHGTYQRDDELGGSVPAAAVTYRQIAARYPSSDVAPSALQKLAVIYADRKQFVSAARTYETLAARDADGRYDAWFAAAEIYDKRLKDPDRARDAYARVPPSSPHYADALRRR